MCRGIHYICEINSLHYMHYTFLFISGGEVIIVFLVFLLLFGSKKVPELAKGLGKGLREFRKATDDIKREIDSSTSEIKKEVNSSTRNLKKDLTEINKNIKVD